MRRWRVAGGVLAELEPGGGSYVLLSPEGREVRRYVPTRSSSGDELTEQRYRVLDGALLCDETQWEASRADPVERTSVVIAALRELAPDEASTNAPVPAVIAAGQAAATEEKAQTRIRNLLAAMHASYPAMDGPLDEACRRLANRQFRHNDPVAGLLVGVLSTFLDLEKMAPTRAAAVLREARPALALACSDAALGPPASRGHSSPSAGQPELDPLTRLRLEAFSRPMCVVALKLFDQISAARSQLLEAARGQRSAGAEPDAAAYERAEAALREVAAAVAKAAEFLVPEEPYDDETKLRVLTRLVSAEAGRSPANLEALARLLDSSETWLTATYDGMTEHVDEHAALALAEAGPASIPLLAQALESPAARKRLVAARALEGLAASRHPMRRAAAEGAAEALTARARSDPSEEIRSTALRALVGIAHDDPRVTEALFDEILLGESFRCAQAALDALQAREAVPPARHVPALLACFQDRLDRLGTELAPLFGALGRSAPEEVVRALAARLSVLRQDDTRSHRLILAALGRMGSRARSALGAVEAAAAHPDEEVARRAAETAAALKAEPI